MCTCDLGYMSDCVCQRICYPGRVWLLVFPRARVPTCLISWAIVGQLVAQTCVCVRVFVYNWCPRLIVRVCVRRLYTLYAYVLHWCCLGLTVRNIVVLEVIGVPRLRCLYRSRL